MSLEYSGWSMVDVAQGVKVQVGHHKLAWQMKYVCDK